MRGKYCKTFKMKFPTQQPQRTFSWMQKHGRNQCYFTVINLSIEGNESKNLFLFIIDGNHLQILKTTSLLLLCMYYYIRHDNYHVFQVYKSTKFLNNARQTNQIPDHLLFKYVNHRYFELEKNTFQEQQYTFVQKKKQITIRNSGIIKIIKLS